MLETFHRRKLKGAKVADGNAPTVPVPIVKLVMFNQKGRTSAVSSGRLRLLTPSNLMVDTPLVPLAKTFTHATALLQPWVVIANRGS
jgi:hypothetical protein